MALGIATGDNGDTTTIVCLNKFPGGYSVYDFVLWNHTPCKVTLASVDESDLYPHCVPLSQVEGGKIIAWALPSEITLLTRAPPDQVG